jgi:hypothetical protein
LEAEAGLTTVGWPPELVDHGTQQVINSGMRVLFERGPILSRL